MSESLILYPDAPDGIDFSPADEMTEIFQNVRTIVATARGSVPLDRDFGVSWHFLDMPTSRARLAATHEIADQVAKYEPRAQVERVDWDETGGEVSQGRLKPRITLKIIETGGIV